MSQEIPQKKIPKWAYVLIGAAGLGMLLFDAQSMQSHDANQKIAEVNGQEISRHQLERAVSDLRATGQAPSDDNQLRQEALDALISQILFRQQALSSGYQLSDQSLYQYIKAQFGDDKTYQQMLDANRITAQAYQEGIRQSQSVENYYRLLSIAAAPQTNPALIAQLSLARDITAVRLPLAPFAAAITPDEAAIAEFFQTQQHNYLSAPKVNLSYLLLSPAQLARPEAVSAEQIEAAKAERAANVVRGGKYLIFDQASDAEQAAADIAAATRSFAEISTAVSEGKIAGQAGDLNPNPKGKGISKEVDEALFAIASIGDTSPVFHTEYGAMLVQLGSIEGAAEIDEATLRQEIAQAQSNARFTELANQLFDAAQSGTPLADLAAQVGLSVQNLDNIDPTSQAANWLSQPQVQSLLFGDKAVAVNSAVQAVDLTDSSLFLVVNARQEAAPLPLEAVRSQVEQDYKNQQAKASQQAAAEQMAQLLSDKSANLSQAVAEAQGEQLNYKQLSYLATPSADMDLTAYQLLLTQNSLIAQHQLPDNSILVAKIEAIAPLAADSINPQLQAMLSQQSQFTQHQALQSGMAQWLRAQSKIQVDNAALSASTQE